MEIVDTGTVLILHSYYEYQHQDVCQQHPYHWSQRLISFCHSEIWISPALSGYDRPIGAGVDKTLTRNRMAPSWVKGVDSGALASRPFAIELQIEVR